MKINIKILNRSYSCVCSIAFFFSMENFAVLGSDSEDEMTNKPEYIQALRDVQTFDGKFQRQSEN